MHTDERRMRKRPMRIRYTNRFKCLLCYVFALALPLLWQGCALGFIYPYKLAATAPALPFSFVEAAENSLRARLAAQEQNWLMCLAGCALFSWIVSVLLQLLWRVTRRVRLQGARATQKAVHAYRLLMLLVWGICLAFAWLIWQYGVRLIPGRTLWDYLAYFGFYLLLPLAVMTVSRLAAPSAISGKHAFFKRL